jgi:hypothetical protein
MDLNIQGNVFATRQTAHAEEAPKALPRRIGLGPSSFETAGSGRLGVREKMLDQ